MVPKLIKSATELDIYCEKLQRSTMPSTSSPSMPPISKMYMTRSRMGLVHILDSRIWNGDNLRDS